MLASTHFPTSRSSSQNASACFRYTSLRRGRGAMVGVGEGGHRRRERGQGLPPIYLLSATLQNEPPVESTLRVIGVLGTPVV